MRKWFYVGKMKLCFVCRRILRPVYFGRTGLGSFEMQLSTPPQILGDVEMKKYNKLDWSDLGNLANTENERFVVFWDNFFVLIPYICFFSNLLNILFFSVFFIFFIFFVFFHFSIFFIFSVFSIFNFFPNFPILTFFLFLSHIVYTFFNVYTFLFSSTQNSIKFYCNLIITRNIIPKFQNYFVFHKILNLTQLNQEMMKRKQIEMQSFHCL